ncbi:MAG TPA: DUF87 domain-containing protein [Methylocella sp.]|nr:DUF87 domain-containing protein [Methylocella sp.]
MQAVVDQQPAANSGAPAKPLGTVIAVRGSQASIQLAGASSPSEGESRVTVGKFLGIDVGTSLLVSVVTDVSLQSELASSGQQHKTVAILDLIGEIENYNSDSAGFRRGVADYPAIGDEVKRISSRDLHLIFNVSAPAVIEIGTLQQDSAIGAYIDVNDMLSKHFSVLGTTGVGKSSAIALILQQTLAARPDLRVLILDVHNEYRPCFGDKAQVLSPRNMKLPFWLFNFEEIVDIFFGERPGLDEEIDLLSEVIPTAKANYSQASETSARLAIKSTASAKIRYTVDMPVPYRVADLISMLDSRMGKLENRSSRMLYQKLMTRIETVSSDPRYSFIFDKANVGGDTMAEILGLIFRQPANGVPVTIIQLAGFPSEVIDSLVSVLSRMAFDFGMWSEGMSPLLLVCEEAHRYISADVRTGFGPTRRAISRIAKEGRKYGVFLGLISQRPAELDPTILSQCSTLFAMRMTNDRDQTLLRSAVSDTSSDLFSFLPSLGTGEVFAFGEGVALPTRLKIKQLPAELLPKSEPLSHEGVEEARCDQGSLAAIVDRWRGAMERQKSVVEKPTAEKTNQDPLASAGLRRLGSSLGGVRDGIA